MVASRFNVWEEFRRLSYKSQQSLCEVALLIYPAEIFGTERAIMQKYNVFSSTQTLSPLCVRRYSQQTNVLITLWIIVMDSLSGALQQQQTNGNA